MKHETPKNDPLARAAMVAGGFTGVLRELYDGVRTRSLPLGPLIAAVVFAQFAVLLRLDRAVFRALSILWLYPATSKAFAAYYCFLLGTPFLVWALARLMQRRRLIDRLSEVFQASGLKNNLGKFPRFLFDRPIDPVTRKLRVTSAVLSLSAFQKAKPAIESGLQIYVDEFREIRKLGAVDIVYAHEPMPAIYKLDPARRKRGAEYFIGTTRSKALSESLDAVPHLLVAGQTGGGKSTFLRQFITTIYTGPEKTHFLLIDLKGGLEFQLFERLPRVEVPENMSVAIQGLTRISGEVERRMALLRTHRCKDLGEYRKLRTEKPSEMPALDRYVIVVDEAAEMFLAGQHASGANVQHARKVLSQVARQGRSLGVHLIVATQRPDSRALDPQVKANLPGVLCFQMVNDISSITVLGNGRATDLPPIPGRAIWKCGADFVEVQTPFMTPQEAEALLEPHRIPDSVPVKQVADKTKGDAPSGRKESR